MNRYPNQTIYPERPTWVEIDHQALANNIRFIDAHTGPDVALMAVVKANAYGHGSVEVSKTALHHGADYLGVAALNEAVPLREAGIAAPILVLGYTPSYLAERAISYHVAVTLYDLKNAGEFNVAAQRLNSPLTAHIKIDTGMGRLGLRPEQTLAFFEQIRQYDHLNIEGIFTHFSVADSVDQTYTLGQLEQFNKVLDDLHENDWKFKYIHAANSAAILSLPESHFSMVRAGIAMYGLDPSPEVPVPSQLRPVLGWKTTIAHLKTLPPGSNISYGNTYQTQGVETIATLPVGYADGFRRAPRHFGEVLVSGQRVLVVGRVCMDQIMINVTGISDVKAGDEVVIIGRQGQEKITAEDAAERIGTINYEVVSAILARVPRINLLEPPS